MITDVYYGSILRPEAENEERAKFFPSQSMPHFLIRIRKTFMLEIG